MFSGTLLFFQEMWELDYKESWALKNWCFCIVVLEKTVESPLDCKEIQPVHPNGNQSWIFIGRTDGEAETPVLWPPDVKNWLIWKNPDARKDWRWEEKGTTEGEMVGWHHRLNGHEFEQALGVGDGQGGLARCSPWGRRESDMAEWQNWTELTIFSWMKKFLFNLANLNHSLITLHFLIYFFLHINEADKMSWLPLRKMNLITIILTKWIYLTVFPKLWVNICYHIDWSV